MLFDGIDFLAQLDLLPLPFFSRDVFYLDFFEVILSNKTSLLQFIGQWQMKRGSECQQNWFWKPRGPLRQFLAMSDILF